MLRFLYTNRICFSFVLVFEVACLLVTSCSVLTYSMILSETIPAVLQNVLGLQVSRTQTLVGVTLTVILPLCLLRDLASLAPFSLVGIMAMMYTSAAMVLRWLTGAYQLPLDPEAAPTLASSLAAHLKPSFGSKGWNAVFSSQSAILISMLSTAFMAHYNAPKFYWELKDRSVPRFLTVVRVSFLGALMIMALVAAAGFGTFGAASSGLILNNYAVSDNVMALSRLAVTISLICSYPLAFVGVRDGVLDLCQVVDAFKRKSLFVPVTLGLLTVITTLAYYCRDISVIMALGGATWGNAVIYLFPAWMMIQLAKEKPHLESQVPAAFLTGLIGLVLATVGTSRALQKL